MYDYLPNGADELALNKGETLVVRKQNEDGWWEGEKNGQTGIFPANFVKVQTYS